MPRKMPILCVLIFSAWLLCPPAIGGAERPAVTQHDIAPLMMLRCTACHGPRKQEAKLDLRTRESMLRGGKSGPAIVPGKPEKSLLIKAVLREDTNLQMPPDEKLSAAEIELLTEWIKRGAPDPRVKRPISKHDENATDWCRCGL